MGELLEWVGKFIDFSILVYFYLKFVKFQGELSDIWIATFGIVIGLIIYIYNLLEKWGGMMVSKKIIKFLNKALLIGYILFLVYVIYNVIKMFLGIP